MPPRRPAARGHLGIRDYQASGRRRSGSATSAAGRLGRLRLLDEFAFDRDLDLLADDHPAVQDGVETKPEVLPIDLGGGAIGDPVSHHARIVELPVLHHVEHYGARGLLDRKVAGQLVMVLPGRFDARALEFDERVFAYLEEVRRLY